VSQARGKYTDRGQALAELGIIIVLVLMLAMGIIEFGRMLMIANVITHAARDGARAAAVLPSSSRDSSGMITNTSAIQSRVISHISNAVNTSGFSVNVSQPAASSTGGIPMVTVQVTGSVPYVALFNLVGSSLNIDRSVTFRDEGR
jgi:Flp pilus assembly protein TadG